MNTTTTAEPPLRPGERVYVRNQNMAGKTIIEGDAIIVRPASDSPGDNRFKVCFRGERCAYSRTVLPEHRRKEPI
jgi:hypothetical protein